MPALEDITHGPVRRGRPAAALVSCLLVACAWLALAGAAGAAPGQLSYEECLGSVATLGCVDLPFAPLDSATDVAVSPDGTSVYATARTGSIAHFSRGGPTGRLSYQGCLGNDASQGCVDLPGAPLGGAKAVALSPDGRSVYVVSVNANVSSVSHLFRDPATGRLAWDGCLNNDGSQSCGDLPGRPLFGVSDVAVSPDGRSVYTVSSSSNSLAHFFRVPDGQIFFDGCLADTGFDGCGDLPGAPISGATGVAVSPDGTSVYVVALGADSIAHFPRTGPGGQVVYDGCLSSEPRSGCVALPGPLLDRPLSLAVSPDGGSVYVVSEFADSIARFARGRPGGRITYAGCLADTIATTGCTDLPGAPLDGPQGVAVSPDGESVYVVSDIGNSVAHLRRGGAEGQLVYEGCSNDDGSRGCADLPGTPLARPAHVAVSPDGGSVYVASFRGDAVAHLVREGIAAPDPGPPGPRPPGPVVPDPGIGAAPPDTRAPSISAIGLTPRRIRVVAGAGARARRRAPAGATLRYRLSEPAVVSIAVERALAGRRVATRCRPASRRPGGRPPCRRWQVAGRPLVVAATAGANRLRLSGRVGRRALRPGVHRARLVATDRAGNRSHAVTVRFHVVRQ